MERKKLFFALFPQKFHGSTKLKIQSAQTNVTELTFKNLHRPESWSEKSALNCTCERVWTACSTPKLHFRQLLLHFQTSTSACGSWFLWREPQWSKNRSSPCKNSLPREPWSTWEQNIPQHPLRGSCISKIIPFLRSVFERFMSEQRRRAMRKKKPSNPAGSSICTTYPSWTNTSHSKERPSLPRIHLWENEALW